MAIVKFCLSLQLRAGIFLGHRMQDLHAMVELMPFARATKHPSVSTAYGTALSLMQDTHLFAPTVQLQQTTLAASPEYSHAMLLVYVSHRIELGQFKQAIENLERGRALLWSEMRLLRISIDSDQVRKADLDLGDKFAAVNRELEELTKAIPLSHKFSMGDAVTDDLRAGDKFGSLLLRQREVLKEPDRLISQIRALPDLERFMLSPSFDTLRCAAPSGPVIIVNHCKLEPRSDILILLHDASPSLIPTPLTSTTVRTH
jgi:hypothetical protein